MSELPLRRRPVFGVAAGLVGVAASFLTAFVIALPVAHADCDTVGQTASQTVQSYLDRHPDVKSELKAKAQAEGGSNESVIDYLGRHPDVRNALVKLANKCTP
jgi:hypothetical protein